MKRRPFLIGSEQHTRREEHLLLVPPTGPLKIKLIDEVPEGNL